MLRPHLFLQIGGDVGSQLATNTQHINDIERRVQNLERDMPLVAVQSAAMQAQLDAIRQMLVVVIGAMVTLAVEAIWRMAAGKKPKQE